MSVYYTMNSTVKRGKKPAQRNNKRAASIPVNYSKALISRNVPVPIVNIGANLDALLQRVIASSIEGKCIADGYVKPNTTKVLAYSSGTIKGDVVFFNVSFECLVCYPLHGMKLSCVVKNITKAGIRAESDENPNPIVVFIARDHHNTMPYFSQVNEGDKIDISVIGQRFELNDKYISIIAELVEPNKIQVSAKKPRIEIQED
jgi:DNA-directed RNA polymerase subunit E'/Rpb7